MKENGISLSIQFTLYKTKRLTVNLNDIEEGFFWKFCCKSTGDQDL